MEKTALEKRNRYLDQNIQAVLKSRIEKTAAAEKRTWADTAGDVASFIPGTGGFVQGMMRPAKGTSRLESSTASGILGGIGGIAGGLTGLTAGFIINHYADIQGDPAKWTPLLLGLAGSSAGTSLGSNSGRMLAARDAVTPEELANSFRAAAKAQGTTA